MIRVMVVADSAAARARLVGSLAGDDRLEVVAQAPALSTVEQLVGAGGPDVVVAAVDADDDRAADAVIALAARPGAPPVVAVVGPDSGAWVDEALQAGVRAVIPRDAGPAEIQAAVGAAAAGLVVVRPEDVPETRRGPDVDASLTPRELQVLDLLGEGLGNKAIAARLAITERTVKFHVGAIFEKLGVSSRTEAVTAALRRGLLLL
jgi:two-component system, NarL family, response regulator YdfI